ncbi:MAG TPA: hypothetical protein VMB50_15940 [Myxococcales bacterium]|nr:hypothetical protein [Myxococcales bacterium]
MKWTLGWAILLGGCGTHLATRDAVRLRAMLGLAASEVATAADPPRLKTIADDLASSDPATQKLGEAECILLETRAQELGREVAALGPILLPGADLERTSADLQGAVSCLAGAPLEAGRVGRTLRMGTEKVQKALAASGK